MKAILRNSRMAFLFPVEFWFIHKSQRNCLFLAADSQILFNRPDLICVDPSNLTEKFILINYYKISVCNYSRSGMLGEMAV